MPSRLVLGYNINNELSSMKLLVPTAGPTPAKEKAEYLSKLACNLEAEIIILHIVRDGNEKAGKDAFEIIENQCNKDKVKVKSIIERGEIIPTIDKVAESENVDSGKMAGG